jgi:hypothetical protein
MVRMRDGALSNDCDVSDDGRRGSPLLMALDQLVARITDENRHDETDWGPPVGREAW